jgi:hypothetical protein
MSGCITLENTNTIFGLMLKQMDLNIVASLDSEEQELLDNVSNFLNNILKSQNMNFDEDAFKNLVKKLYPKNSQFGGEDDDKVVTYDNQQERKKSFTKYDFFAIISLLVSIYFCWVAFIKINEISVNTSGLSLANLPPQLVKDVETAVQQVKSLSTNDLSFLQILYKSMTTFSCSIADSQIANIQTFVSTAITSSITNTKDIILQNALEHCGMKTEVLSQEWGTLGTLVNTLSSGITASLTSDSTAQCMVMTTNAQLTKLVHDQVYAISIMTAELSAQGAQISALLSKSAQFGGASIAYFTYRISGMIPKGFIGNDRNSQNRARIANYGGKKNRKSKRFLRKTKKTNKSYRKSRKTKKNSRKSKKNIF